MHNLKNSLTLQMVIATLVGIFFGLFFGDYLTFFKPWTDAYIMILKITILPYLVAAIVHGIGQLGIAQSKEILKKGVIFLGLAWAINIFVIYLVYFCFPQIKAKGLATYNPEEKVTLNFAQLLIPENIFAALTHNLVPAIVVFSVLLGIAFMCIKNKENAMSLLETVVDALTTLTSWISKITPVGTFMIIAYQVGTMELTTVKQVTTYILFYILAICTVVFWIFPRLTSMLTTLNGTKWLKDMLPVLLLAYTTNVVIVCLPFIMQLVQRETLILLPKDDKAQSQIQGTVSVIFNVPLGSLFMALFILFCSIFFQVPLSVFSQIKLFIINFLTSLGAVGIGSWLNSLTFLIENLGLPLDSIDLFLTTIPFTAGFQSMASAMEIATLSLFITFACRKLIRFNWKKFIPSLAITFIPVIFLFGILYFYNPFPPIRNTTKSIYEIAVLSNVKSHIHTSRNGISPAEILPNEDTFDRIVRTKTLRVGYYPDVAPFSFYNQEKELAGYDIMLAYTLAQDLDCSLELIPIDYDTISQDLDNNLYDVGMSAITINEERLKKVSFTEPYVQSQYVFVVKGPKNEDYVSHSYLKEKENIKIAVLKGSSYALTAKAIFPQKEIILLNTYEDFLQTGPEVVLLWAEPQAIPWISKHPNLHIITPTPSVGTDSLGYPVNERSGRFLTFLNQWLELKKTEGFTAEQYKLWVLGKTNLAKPEGRRWSILNNVLGFRQKSE